MPCFRPIAAFVPLDGGAVVFHEKKEHREVQIPCGGCIGCRIEKIDAWGFRCMAEASMHKESYFVTLTYDDKHLPIDESLNHRDWQLFAHRLRKRLGPFRFFMCGEYGENTERPHFHALLFGCVLPDLRRVNSVYSSADLFDSGLLNEVWGKGFTTVGNVSLASAKYCAGYVLKRVSEEVAAERYSWVTRFGEVVLRKQPYGRMSLKPGIGAEWLLRYSNDVVNHGAVFENQFRKKVPVYFSRLLETVDPMAFEELQSKVIQRGIEFSNPENNTRERLSVRERCRQAAVAFKKERSNHAL